jgi:hypothetical protein
MKMNANNENFEVVSIEYNDDLNGFICELENGKVVQVQFYKNCNALHADFGEFYAHIDLVNDYGFNLDEKEIELFKIFMRTNEQIKAKAQEFTEIGIEH